jgi:YgiT-type zinc finger domain-containing protein
LARKTVTCDVCGKDGAHERTATRTFGKGADMLVVEGIPYVQCPHCGEGYFTAPTLLELEKIKANRDTLTRKRTLPFAVFPTKSRVA